MLHKPHHSLAGQRAYHGLTRPKSMSYEDAFRPWKANLQRSRSASRIPRLEAKITYLIKEKNKTKH